MVLAAGKMYRPTDIAVDTSNNAIYVVEQYNHRVSKWVYNPTGASPNTFTLDAGRISSTITITAGGSGYTDAAVTFSAPTDTSGVPLVTATGTVNLTGAVSAITVVSGGTSYTAAETVTITGVTSGATGATGTITVTAGVIQTVTIVLGGTGYTQGEAVTMVGVTSTASDATGTATTTASAVISITVDIAGSGYTTAPTLTITSTTGSSATATALLVTSWGSNSNGTTGTPGTTDSTTDNFFFYPTGIILSGSTLHVTDTFNHRIKDITIAAGVVTTTAGSPGTGTSNFYRPTGIDISSTRIMIADSRNNRCVSYTIASPPVFSAVTGTPTTAFHTPRGIAFNSTDTQFKVFDEQNGIGYVYSADGTTFSSEFGTAGNNPSLVTNLYAPASGHGETTGTETPFADTRNNAIKLVNGTTITNPTNEINTAGSGSGEMYLPESAIAFTDTSNYILVANTLNHRIDVFDGTGTLQSTFGTPF